MGLDRQEKAIENTRRRLSEAGGVWDMAQVELCQMCHSLLGIDGPVLTPGSVKLVCYNLGHLPGSEGVERIRNRTQVGTTLASLRRSIDLLAEGGMISVMCYTHEEGVQERDALVSFAENLERAEFSVMQFTSVNAKAAPTLLCIYKR